jgi:PAS domain-containing protein
MDTYALNVTPERSCDEETGEAARQTERISLQPVILHSVDDGDRLPEELAEAKLRMHFLAESMPQLLWTANREGQCTFVSEPCARFVGVPANELHGDGWFQFIHPDDVARTAAVWKAAVEQQNRFGGVPDAPV